MTDRVAIISADGHAAAPMPSYRPYLEKRYLRQFDDFVERYEEARAGSRVGIQEQFFPRAVIEPYLDYMVRSGAIDGEFDVERRLQEVKSQGVVAEVLFPNSVPFHAAHISFGAQDYELQLAGQRAYNRWLSDFCAPHPERFIGHAMIHFVDVDAAVREIYWAKDHGLRGVMLPGIEPNLPAHWDPALEPIWSALEDTGLPANVHGGAGLPALHPPGALPARVALRVVGEEFSYFSHRPLFFMLWSGVFERHPQLELIFTEQYADWIPRTLAYLDWQWEKDRRYGDDLILELCPRRPSEYWARQCFAGMSLCSRAEVELRHAIGIDNVMFGVDFPHLESTYPHTKEVVQALVHDVHEDEARKFLGLNAAKVFDLDQDALARVTERVAYHVDEIFRPPSGDTAGPAFDDVNRPLG